MKQIDKNSFVLEKLRQAEMDPNNVTVFEAVALNTNPVRKNHFLFKGSVHDRSVLQEMAAAVNAESLPLQIMHDTEATPSGRVIYGEVKDVFGGSELRVIFAVDNTEADTIKKVETGTINQVSVSILVKEALCSECGFDFFGADSDIEYLMSATCPNGHTMGKDGAHIVSKGLAQWFEMSLVGKGGAVGAKIMSRDQAVFKDNRLVANGIDPLFLTGFLKTEDLESLTMDMTVLITQLTDAKAGNVTYAAQIEAQKAELTAMKTELEALKATMAEGQEISVDQYNEALTVLEDVAKKVSIASGEIDPKLTDLTVKQLSAKIFEKADALVTALAAAGKAKEVTDDIKDTKSATSLTAFRGVN